MANVVERLYAQMRTNPKSFAHCLSFVSASELKQFNIASIFKKMTMDGIKPTELSNVADSFKLLVERGADINQTTTWTIKPENKVQIVTLAHVIASWGDSNNPIFIGQDDQLYRNFIFAMEHLGMKHDTYDRDGKSPYDWACQIESNPQCGYSYYKELRDSINFKDKLERMLTKRVDVSNPLAKPGGKI